MELLNKKNLIILAAIFAVFSGVKGLLNQGSNNTANHLHVEDQESLHFSNQGQHQAFVQPKQVKENSKVQKTFNQRLKKYKTNKPVDAQLIKTTAHNFHSDKHNTLEESKKEKKVVSDKNKKKLAEDKKRRNQEAIAEQVAEQCQYDENFEKCTKHLTQQLTDQAELEKCESASQKDEEIKACREKVQDNINARKEAAKANQTKPETRSSGNSNNGDNNSSGQDNDDNNDNPSDDGTDENPNSAVVTNINPQDPNADPESSSSNPEGEGKTEAEWRALLEEANADMSAIASEMVTAVGLGAKKGMASALFFQLINEYYLSSSDIELHKLGINTLQALPGRESFIRSVDFLNEKISSNENNLYNELFYGSLQKNYESFLSFHYLGAFLADFGLNKSSENNENWDNSNYLYVTMTFLKIHMETLKNSIGAEQLPATQEVYRKYTPYLPSLQNTVTVQLQVFTNTEDFFAPAKSEASELLTLSQSLIESIESLKPVTETNNNASSDSSSSFFTGNTPSRR